MDTIAVLVVILASLISGIVVHIFDKNRDGSITKEEIEETIKEALNKK